MDTNELNIYIKNYLENDKTQRAIMLTAPWGSGKSYYIKNSLCPFLSENDLDYAVVSLYGLKELKELNKNLYLEIRSKKDVHPSERRQVTKIVGKTIVKGIASFFGVDLSQSDEDLKKLYESIDLKNKLIIFEDLERTSIDIIEFLGYVNNITENDGAKVLLVANEQEIVKVRYKKDEFTNKEVPEYTEYAERYLKIREKTISDTIRFYSDYHSTIKSIIERFSNKYFEEMMRATDKTGEISLIRRILQQINNSTEINYRALIYACQKTEDFLNKVGESDLNLEFVENLFIGTVMYSFKIHNGNRKEWKDISFTSAEFGSYAYPLYKIMFDFINFQAFRIQDVKYMEEIFLKTKNISNADSVLERIYVYYKIPEKEVKEALVEVENYLTRDSGIVHNEYVKIANYLIAIKHHLELHKEVDACISKMLENTKRAVNSGEEVQVYLSSGVQLLSEEEIKEFNKFKQDMHNIINSKRDELDFDYNPESLYSFYDKIVTGKRSFINEGGFANKLDVNRVLEMLSNCLPKQIEEFRGILQYIYMGISNISEFLSEDAINLQKIKIGVDELIKDKKKFDKTQVLQFSWLSKNLDGIINKLKGGKNGF